VFSRTTVDVINVIKAVMIDNFLIIHTQDSETGVNTIACYVVNLGEDPPVMFVDEIDGFSFNVNTLDIGTFSALALTKDDGVRVVFTDGKHGLRGADFYAINSEKETVTYDMPITTSDIGDPTDPDHNVNGLRPNSKFAGVELRGMDENDDQMDMTISTKEFQIWDITYTLRGLDKVLVNSYYYAIGNYNLHPTILAFGDNFAVFAKERPDSQDSENHWVIYTSGQPNAHGTGPHYSSDVYASEVNPIAFMGPGKDTMDGRPPQTKNFYVHSFWASDQL